METTIYGLGFGDPRLNAISTWELLGAQVPGHQLWVSMPGYSSFVWRPRGSGSRV